MYWQRRGARKGKGLPEVPPGKEKILRKLPP